MSFTKNTLIVATVAALSIATSFDASACGGKRTSGYSHNYHRPSYNYNHNNYHYKPSYKHQPTVRVINQRPVVNQTIPQHFVQQPPQITPAPSRIPAGQPQLQPQQVPQLQTQQAPQVQPQQAPQVQPQHAPVNNASMSALQALAAFAPPAGNPAPQTPAIAGTWTASIGKGATVQLQLGNEGQFTWTATNPNGQSSSFSGTYSTGNGSLSLIRSNDNQTLAGSMTLNGNTFSFKLADNNAATLNFNRS